MDQDKNLTLSGLEPFELSQISTLSMLVKELMSLVQENF